jgi:hypothetical protein
MKRDQNKFEVDLLPPQESSCTRCCGFGVVLLRLRALACFSKDLIRHSDFSFSSIFRHFFWPFDKMLPGSVV